MTSHLLEDPTQHGWGMFVPYGYGCRHASGSNQSIHRCLSVARHKCSTAYELHMCSQLVWYDHSTTLRDGNYVMWSCVSTLAVDGLGEYTSRASGVFMMGVFGGAVFPVLQGMMADWIGSWQFTWTIALVCEFVLLWYGLRGYRK